MNEFNDIIEEICKEENIELVIMLVFFVSKNVDYRFLAEKISHD